MRFPEKKLVVFDLDDTLAPSKEPISDAMGNALAELLEHAHVAIITGGQWERCKTQVLDRLPAHANKNLHKLFALPTCGTRLYIHRGGAWEERYAELLDPQEAAHIESVLAWAIEGMYDMSELYGNIIENRGSQVTMSGFGQQAPLAKKRTFDPDQSLRRKIIAKATPKLSNYELRIAGASSVDVTKKGLDKAYGIKKIRDHLGITLDEIGFVGDALYEGGNDYPALTLGIHCIQVKNPEDTLQHIASWVA